MVNNECLHPEEDVWFSREICPEPCGMMHYFCGHCGKRMDHCALDDIPPEVPLGAQLERATNQIVRQMFTIDQMATALAKFHGTNRRWVQNAYGGRRS